MPRLFHTACLLGLALSLLLTSLLAYRRFMYGQPALQDFAALQESGPLPFIRPPFYQPLRGLPLRTAAALWLGLNAAAGFGLGVWTVRRTREPALALLLAVFLPALVALSVGQDTLLLVAALAGVFALLERRRPLTAGIFLSVLWVKFVWLPAFLLLLAFRREWRALTGWLAGTFILWAPVLGEAPSYATKLWDIAANPAVVSCRTCMPNLHALIPDARLALAGSVAVLALAATRFRAPLPDAFALAATAALVASHHAHIYDCLLLFLAVVLVMGRSVVRAWAISPLPYLLPYLAIPGRVIPALTAISLLLSLWRQSRNEGRAG